MIFVRGAFRTELFLKYYAVNPKDFNVVQENESKKDLNTIEKTKINVYKNQGRSCRYIAERIGRSESAVSNCVCNKENYGIEGRILHEAPNSALSLAKIKAKNM